MDIVMSDEGESEEGMSEERSLNNILKQMHDRAFGEPGLLPQG